MLTARRVNGIKEGFWSAANKETLVQKLGALEERGVGLLDETCGKLCLDAGRELCGTCPIQALRELLKEDRR